ncbi:N-acetyltransferase eso1, partial [Coemansia sp. RSA 2424]
MDVIRRLCPTMSKASIDEAFLDVSEIVRDTILLDLERGQLEWASSEEAAWANDALLRSDAIAEPALMLPVPVVRWITASRKGKEREPVNGPLPGATDFGILVGDAPPVSYNWGDLQLKYAAKFASHVRSVVFQELGYQCSAGIAHNKLLAKIGSALNKPNVQTVFLQSQVEAFMYTFPLSSLPSLGGKLGALVEAAFDARTAGDIMHYTVEQLAFKLGQDQALLVFNKCRAIDNSEVADKSEPQSLSSTKNFMRYPISSLAKLERWISMNGTDLWMRTSEEWELRKRWPRSLTIGYTTNGMTTRSRTVPFPSRHVPSMRHSPDAIVIAARACLAKIAAGDGIGHGGSGAGLFPLISLSLTAKAFQRELANVAMMEKWLTTKPAAPQDAVAAAGAEPPEEEELLSPPSDLSEPSDDEDLEMDGHLYEGGMPESCSSDVSSPASSNDLHHIPDPPVPGVAPMFGLAASQAMPNLSTFADAAHHHHHMHAPMLPPPPPPTQPAAAAPSSAMYTHGLLASSVDALSAAPTPPLVPSRSQHARGGDSDGRPVSGNGYMAWADSMRPPPLLPATGAHAELGMDSDYDSSDSEQSCLRTPQETDSEDCE